MNVAETFGHIYPHARRRNRLGYMRREPRETEPHARNLLGWRYSTERTVRSRKWPISRQKVCPSLAATKDGQGGESAQAHHLHFTTASVTWAVAVERLGAWVPSVLFTFWLNCRVRAFFVSHRPLERAASSGTRSLLSAGPHLTRSRSFPRGARKHIVRRYLMYETYRISLAHAPARSQVRADGRAAIPRDGVSRRDPVVPTQRKADIRQHGRSGRSHEVAPEREQGASRDADSLIVWAFVALAVALLLYAAHLEYVDVLLGSVTG